MANGAGELPPRPWRPAPVPPSATELLEFALWRAASTPDRRTVEAALALVAAARAEVDQLEVGALFAARSSGLTWAEIARQMGLNSPQAVQQRLERRRSRGSTP